MNLNFTNSINILTGMCQILSLQNRFHAYNALNENKNVGLIDKPL